MSAPELHDQLARLRSRARMLGWTQAIAWGVFACLAVLLAWAWIDLLLDAPTALRLAGFAAAVAALVAMLAWHLRKSAAGWGADALARRLDAAAGAQGQIVSGFDLSREVRATAGSPAGLTQGLAVLATDRAGKLASAAPLTLAAPARGAKRALLALAGIAVAVVLLLALFPSLVRAQWARMADPFGDHPVYSQIQIDVQPGNVKVVYGGDLDIRATVAGGAVDRLEAVLVAAGGTEEAVPMFADSGGQWRTSLSGLIAPGAYYVRAHQTRSPRFSIDVITVPRITGVTAKITPPAYTHLPASEGPIPSEGIAALPQTTVEFRAKSNRPLSGGTLAVTFAGRTENVALAPIGGTTEVRGTLQITEAAKLAITVKDTAGQTSTDVFSTSATPVPDQRPFVRIVEPRAQSYATPNAKLPVELLAEDDYGITGITLYRTLNDSRPMGLELTPKNDTPRQRSDTILSLAGLGLQPGDSIRLVGRALDNDPAGAKGSESAPTIVQIISQADYNKMMVARAGLEMLLSKYEQAQRRMETAGANLRKLKEELSRLPPDSPLPDAIRKEAGDIGDTAEGDANEVDDSKQLALPFDIDKEMAPRLDDVANRLHNLASDLRQGTPRAGKVQDELALVDGLISGLEQEEKSFAGDVIEPLDYLSKIYPLIADQEKFVMVYQRESGLAERLAGMKENEEDPREKARMRDMEVEQRHVRETLETLLVDIKSHAERIPDDPRIQDFRQTAWDFSDAVRKSQAGDYMSGAEIALAEFWGKSAHTQAADAVKALKDFIGEGGGGSMGQKGKDSLKFQPQLNQAMGNTVGQLLSAAGLGGGGGYSNPGGNSDNVGLYGNSPLTRANRSGNAPGTGLIAGGSVSDQGAPGAGATGSATVTGGGAAAVPVPPQYRKRVDQYFQRVADEIQKE